MKRLVELMEKNVSLATNFKRGVPQTASFKSEWEEVAATLNSLGPPIRDGKEWQKVWCDAKFKVKKKIIFNKKEVGATGGGSSRQKYLNETDEVIVKLLALNEPVNPVGNVFGGIRTTKSAQSSTTQTTLPSTSSTIAKTLSVTPITDAELETLECFIGDSDLTITSPVMHLEDESGDVTAKIKNLKACDDNILKNILERQIQIQTNLNDVKDSLNRIEVQLKESSQYHGKRLYLEEKRLKLYEIQLEREEKQRVEENELKMMDLEIKKRQLDIEEQKMWYSEQCKESRNLNV